MLLVPFPGAGPLSYPLPSQRSGGGEEPPATYHLKYTAVFTQGLPLHENNDAIEQKLPQITVTNLPYREFYRGHELKATF